MTVPYAFGAATSAIPLSQLDSNFNTPITLGNTAIQLGNTVTTLNNMALANVTISSGNVTITNVTVTTANATTVNTTTLIATTANVTTGNVTNLISGNVSLTGGSITGTPISGSTGSFTTLTTSGTVTLNGGVANGVAYLDGSKVLTTGSALTFDGSKLTVSATSGETGLLTATGVSNYLSVKGDTGGTTLWAGFGTDTGTVWSGSVSNHPVVFRLNNSEQMRLTSTGLGIGTSSPAYKLDVNGAANTSFIRVSGGSGAATSTGLLDFSSGYTRIISAGASAGAYGGFRVYRADAGVADAQLSMDLDSSGNLGLGVTPSAWSSSGKAMQISRSTFANYNSTNTWVAHNWYVNSSDQDAYVASDYATGYRQTSGQHIWYTAPSGTAGNAITFSQAMTLDASGKLMVGDTSNQGEKLRVYDGSSTSIGIIASTTGESYLNFGDTADANVGFIGYNHTSNYMNFRTNGSERARITSGGDLLVGKTAINNTVVGNELRANGETYSTLSGSTNTDTTLNVFSSGASAYRFYVGLGGTVYATSTTITAISDQRLKENIQDIDVGLDAIMAIKPRKFDWKAGKGKDKKGDRGWIAQEFEQVFPDMVDTWADPAPEGEEPYKAVNADLIPILVKAIQELKAEFDAYKATHP